LNFCADLGTFYINLAAGRRSAQNEEKKTKKKAGEGVFLTTFKAFFAGLYKGSYKLSVCFAHQAKNLTRKIT